ncbi:unnamed protein product [Lymnaea stagnalis]|uniref:Protein N-terminal asparagine amidohydrolase n=1 Tax=Lymnaea stagnalis TaxID=6523 RepID=A0AAV2HRY3_LYMST
MPLIIQDVKVQGPITIESFIKEYPHFQDSSKDLLNQEVRIVGPKKLLFIGQREVAGTSPQDKSISVLGSDDATTCHIAVLRHTGSGATSLIHFDGCSIVKGLESMVAIVNNLTENVSLGRLELHLVGGFLDEKENSHDVSNKILNAVCKSPHAIHLVTACITHHNTVYRNKIPFPVVYGLAVNVKTGELHPASFPDKGPDIPLRGARHFTGGKENIEIYDSKTEVLTIGPFNYEEMPHIDYYLSLSDYQIRQLLSTSPDQEREDFAQNIRASLMQIRDFPNPFLTVFKGQPRRYRKDAETGAWIMIT